MILKNMLNVLRDPDPATDSGAPPLSTTDSSQQTEGLSADQQKIAATLGKTADQQTDSPPTPATKQPKVHKNIFTPPPTAVLEKDFSIGDDDGAMVDGDPGNGKVEMVKADNTKPPIPTPVKPPVAKVEPPVPPTKPTTDVKVKAGDSKPFDYTGFAPEEIAALKQMSTQAKDTAAKAFKELREMKAKAPDIYYQHEEGYTLDPHYKELAQNIDFTAQEVEHWKQQLLAVRQGKPWMLLRGYDDKGRPILDGPHPATDKDDINISTALQVVTGNLGQLQQQRANYGQQYRQRIQQDNAVLQAEMANRFDWVKDPTKLEMKVDIGGKAGEVTIKQMREDFKGLFATYHHGNPVLDMASNMFAALQIYGARIRELEGNKQQQQRLTEDILTSEPVLETKQDGGKQEGVEFDMQGIPE